MDAEERDQLLGSLVRNGGRLAAAVLTDQQRQTGQRLVERGLAEWAPDFEALRLAWVCPICGPSLVVSDGDKGLFCIRHGSEDDIFAESPL